MTGLNHMAMEIQEISVCNKVVKRKFQKDKE